MSSTESAHEAFADRAGDPAVARRLEGISPSSFAESARFWQVTTSAGHLTPKMRELLLLAMHGTSTALNVDATTRQVDRALAVGATEAEIVDVLITLVAVANHASYTTIPILTEELAVAGLEETADAELDTAFEAAKAEFVAARGFWNVDREPIARMMPEFFSALNGISTESWKNGPLSTKERELVCIAIDCTVTHIYEPGLRLHIRNALANGATRAEILQIFQLAATLGLEGYLLAGRALVERDARV